MAIYRYFVKYDNSSNVVNERGWVIYDRIETFGRGDPMAVAKCWRMERADEICQLLNKAEEAT